MTLFTKSIQAKKSKNDGIRVCIMRRPNKEAKFDIWAPILAPSNKLLNDIQKRKIDWHQYVFRFKKEVLEKQRNFLEILSEIALKYNVTILCWEKTAKKCHRQLVAEECKKINPNLKVILK